jgi:hypothetical protein
MLGGRSLKDTLINKIENVYLAEDNKAAEGFFETIGGIFSSSGAKGRKRADDYKSDVVNAFGQDEDDLLLRVYDDIYNPESDLGSSIKLRYRLMQAICEYLAINETEIVRKRQGLVAATYRGVTSGYGPIFPPYHFDMQAMKSLTQGAVEMARARKQENVTTYGVNDAL